MKVDKAEREALRSLASRWMEHASLPVMAERRDQWRALKDLKAERPMILVETCMLDDYIEGHELHCSDPYLRNIERSLHEIVRHADEIGDDIVIDPLFRIPWIIELSDYGIPMEPHHAQDNKGAESLGYSFDFDFKSAADLSRMHLRNRVLHRDETLAKRELLEDIFGDILPVSVGGFDWFNRDAGYHPWLGNLYAGLTMDLFKMVGNDRLLFWVYDEPELVHDIMKIIRDDRIAHFRFLESEGLLYNNTDTWNPCPCSYGFVSDLPESGPESTDVNLKDCWVWVDSQESEPVSPAMLDEFFLPYMAEVAELGGLTYYGCCERVNDRFEHIEKKIPNLRAVSVSGWNDFFAMGEMLGDRYVYSRKPTPAYISGPNPDWDLCHKDVKDTLEAAKNCNLEIAFRDIYTIDGDRKRLAEWVDMVRSMM